MIAEKSLDLVQRCSREIFKDAESKCLRDGRIYAVEYRKSATAPYPSCAAFWVKNPARFSMLRARKSFGTFKTSRRGDVR